MNEELSLCRRPIPSHFGRVTLYNIAEELRCHILGFLAHNEIIRCALTCRTIYLTVKNSLDLQYAIELGTQGLVQVHPRPPTVSITECMHILREHANAWSSFKLNVTKRLHFREISSSWSITHQHLGLSWYIANRFGTAAWPLGNTALSKVVDIKTCTPQMANGPFCTWTKDNPVPGIEPVETCYVDETHDLLVTVDAWKVRLGRKSKCRVKYRVNFRTLSTGKEHPLAHGSQEVVMTGTSDRRFSSTNVYHRMLVIILGDRIALYSGVVLDLSRPSGDDLYLLHVWNWHEGCEADDICVIGKDLFLVELCFLTPEKLLALTSESLIELYDVEDLSKAPQLQARFMMPIRTLGFRFQYPSVYHSASSCAHLRAPDEHWIWTTNPEDRVICVTDFNSASNFVITARLFFMNIPPSWFDETSEDGPDCSVVIMGSTEQSLLPSYEDIWCGGISRHMGYSPWRQPVCGTYDGF
ncbi:hypothetical protein DFH29DRAFT_193333 [Suillus ampliporus]|nr:hypothetical protein DFH29DRAFT_193333 [Suillus ampliporus]